MNARRTSTGLPRTAWVVVIVLAFLTVLSGCAEIPHTGPVVSGREVEGDPLDGVFQFGGYGPVPDATPEDVVSGFLRGAPGFSDNHEVARKFLAPERELTWRPNAAVAVYPSTSKLKVKEIGDRPVVAATATPTPTPAPTGPAPASAKAADAGVADAGAEDRTEVTVTTLINAKIDQDGRYQIAPPNATITQTFGLVKRGGQWRISALDDGILIAASDFGVTFRPFKVYFGDPTRRYLVPELHWFPSAHNDPDDGPELPTALVQVLLQGPPEWLKGAVITGAPAATTMAVDAVLVADDVATVDLSEHVRGANTEDRQLLAAQLRETLRQLRTINSVQITVSRVAFDVPAVSSGSGGDGDPAQLGGQLSADPRVDIRPVLIDSKGRLARLEGRELDVLENVADLSVPGANRPAVSNDSSAYAVLNADRSKVLLQLPGAKVIHLITSAGLTAPSFDPLGWVWSAPGTNTGFVYAAAVGSSRVKVKAPWLKGADVVSLRMSRDGTRAVIAARLRGHAHLFLTGVVRDAQGQPSELNQPPAGLFPSLRTVRDVAWVDEDQLVVLGQSVGAVDEGPWMVHIGGVVQRVGRPVSGAESITAGNGDLSVMAGTVKGVQARSGALWETVSPGRWPAFPG